MDLKQLVAVVTVAEFGSVTRAAQILRIVQPAVTRQIKTLEDELGVALFERTRQGMIVTREAEILLARARRALHELECARSELTPVPGEVTGLVSVGVLESLSELVVSELVEALADDYPGVKLRVLTGFSGYLQSWLDDDVVDIALLYNLSDTPAMRVVPLLSERLWAVAPPGAGLQPSVPLTWRQLLGEPLVLPIVGHGLRSLIDRARGGIDLEPVVAVQTNSMSVQKQMVLAGHGWTVLPAAGVAQDVQDGRLSGAPLGEPALSRSVVIGLPRVTRIPPAVEAVSVTLLRVARGLVDSGRWPSASLPAERRQ